jgi:hypothetical protein
MLYEVTPLPFKPHWLAGLSTRLLVSHYENNYGGTVRRLNSIEHRLGGLDWAATPGFDLNGLGRERPIAANSMLLHEAYFDGLGGSGEPSGGIAGALERDFGSVGRSLAGGVQRHGQGAGRRIGMGAAEGRMRTRKKHGHVGNQRLWFEVPATGKNRRKRQQCDRSRLARGARRGAQSEDATEAVGYG